VHDFSIYFDARKDRVGRRSVISVPALFVLFFRNWQQSGVVQLGASVKIGAQHNGREELTDQLMIWERILMGQGMCKGVRGSTFLCVFLLGHNHGGLSVRERKERRKKAEKRRRVGENKTTSANQN